MPVNLDDIYGVLVEVRDLLRVLTEPPPDEEPGEPVCEHPEEQRTDFSGPGREQWVCRACGYEFPPREE